MQWDTAVVTGASSGIGGELARQLAAVGVRVGLVARRRARLETLADEIRRSGGTAVVAAADVACEADVRRAFDEIHAACGPIDLVIAGAGVGIPTYLDPVNTADVRRTFEVNVLGAIYAFAAAMPEMLRRRRGHLAAVSSLGADVALPGESAYCASKTALSAYLDGLRIHLRDRGVRVTTLAPGFVKTAMTEEFEFPMPGLMDAATAARRMLHALRRGRKTYRFPPVAAWLARCARWLPDRLLARAMRSYLQDLDADRRARHDDGISTGEEA